MNFENNFRWLFSGTLSLSHKGSLFFLFKKQWWNKQVLEKAMATHSTTLAWKIPWTEELGGLQSMGALGGMPPGMTRQLHFHVSLSCIGEGNGNPLQCSWLESPRDREAWWGAVSGVTQSRTQLKRLSSSSISLSQWGSQFYSLKKNTEY